MSIPRNKRAVERAQREREAIREAWIALIERSPFEPVTAEMLRRQCGLRLHASTVRWHMRAIRLAAALTEVSGGDVAEDVGSG